MLLPTSHCCCCYCCLLSPLLLSSPSAPCRDPSSRPSAREALAHPWLQKGNTQQRLQGTQLTQVGGGDNDTRSVISLHSVQ